MIKKYCKYKVAVYPSIKEDGIGTYISNIEKYIKLDFIELSYGYLNIRQFFSSIPRNYDIVHVPSFLVPIYCRNSKIVTTIHDLIPIKFYLLKSPLSAAYLYIRIYFSLIFSDHIIFPSEFTFIDTTKMFGVIKNYSIIPMGVSEINSYSEVNGIPDKFFLCVGRRREHKNIERIIEAFSNFSKIDDTCFLIFTGKADKFDRKYIKLLKDYKIIDKVIFTGNLEHEELNYYYKKAIALLFPSLYEGFGLPILEAMSNNCPVITSKLTSMPEVAGDAAILINPYEVKELLEAMVTVTSPEIRNELIKRGTSRVNYFKWVDTAKKTHEVYDKLMNIDNTCKKK